MYYSIKLEIESKGDRPLKMSFKDQLKAFVFCPYEERISGRYMIQVHKEDDFAPKHITPKDRIEKSSFFEAINNRGLKQLQFVYQNLYHNISRYTQKPDQTVLIFFTKTFNTMDELVKKVSQSSREIGSIIQKILKILNFSSISE